MEGWIKVHRKLVDWEWYNDINVKVVFLHLLLTANHKEKQWKGQTILRGQKLTSIEHLADDVGLTIQQTRTALKKLKSTHEITIKTTSKNSLITIEKFNNYQFEEDEDNKQNNKQLNNSITNNQQTNNKQITTNKNEKNDNNEKNITTVDESCVDGLQEIIDFYNKNIGLITPYGLEVLSDYTKEMPVDLIIYAMQKAVEANKRTIQYIKGILNNWTKNGIKSTLEAEKEDKQFRDNKQSKQLKTKSYNNYEQRKNIDFNKLYTNLGE